MWSNSFKNAGKRMQFSVKLQAVGLMQLYKKQTPSHLFLKDFSADFTTNSLERAISGKPTSPEVFGGCLSLCYYFYFPT